MFKETIRMLKQGSILSLGKIGHGVLQFLLLPIYTRLFNPDDFGILEMLTIFGSLSSLIMLMGIRQGFTRNYLLKEKNVIDQDHVRNQKRIISTTIIFLFIWGTFLAVSMVFFAPQISNILLKTAQYDYLIILSSFWALGLALCQVYQAYFINNGRIKTYVLISFFQLVMNLLLALYWVVWAKKGIQGVIQANLLVNIVFGVFINLWIVLNNKAPFRLKWLKKMLRFGIPSMVGILLLVSFDMIDRFFLNYYFGLSDLGLYSIGRKVVAIISMALVAPFMGIWSPSMYRIANLDNHKEIFARILPLIIFLFSFSSLTVSLFSPEIIRLLTTPIFYDSYRVVIWLSMAQTAYVICSIMTSGINMVGRSEFGIPLNIATLIFGIISNIILVPRFGIVGAASATCITFMFQAGIYYIVAQKLYYIPYQIVKTIVIVGATFIIYYITIFIKSMFITLYVHMIINIIVLLLFAFIAQRQLVNYTERQKIKDYINLILKNSLSFSN